MRCGFKPASRQIRCTLVWLMPIAIAHAPVSRSGRRLARGLDQHLGLQLGWQRRPARRPRLVAREALDGVLGKAPLPVPRARLRLARRPRAALTLRRPRYLRCQGKSRTSRQPTFDSSNCPRTPGLGPTAPISRSLSTQIGFAIGRSEGLVCVRRPAIPSSIWAAAWSRPGCERPVVPKIVFGPAPRRKSPFECGSNGASVEPANAPDGRERFFLAVDDEARDAVVDHFGHRAAPERDHRRAARHGLERLRAINNMLRMRCPRHERSGGSTQLGSLAT